MHYLCSCLVVVFVLAVYLITDEIRYRRDVKRLRMTAVGHYCGQHRARHDNEHAIRHKDTERAVPLPMKKVF